MRYSLGGISFLFANLDRISYYTVASILEIGFFVEEMKYLPVAVAIGIAVGIGFCLLVDYVDKRMKRRRETKQQQTVELTVVNDWEVPSEDDAAVNFHMRMDAGMVEKLHRMTILHRFTHPSMAVRRAIDIVTKLDQVLPDGGCVTMVDNKGVPYKVHIPKVRPDEGNH